MTTRRAFWGTSAAFLGALACDPERYPRLTQPVPGRIVGAHFELGHAVRERLPFPAAAPSSKHRVLIVGTGVSGLSAALELARAGHRDLAIIDVEPEAGGTSRAGSTGGFQHPWGAHYVVAPSADQESMVKLLTDVGMMYIDEDGQLDAHEEYLVRDPEERIFFEGRFYEGMLPLHALDPESRRELPAFRRKMLEYCRLRNGDGRKVFHIPLAAAEIGPEIERFDTMSMAAFLEAEGFRSRGVRFLADYACRDDYGTTSAQTSAFAGIYYFASRDENEEEDGRGYLTVPQGNGLFIRHFLAELERFAVRPKLGHVAYAVQETESGVRVATLRGDRSTHVFEAERVIFAVPDHVRRALLPQLAERNPPLEYGSWLVGNLLMDKRPGGRGAPLAWDNISFHSGSLGYVVATHQAGIDHGDTVLTFYVPLLDDDPKKARQKLYSYSHADCARLLLGELEAMHPGSSVHCKELNVMRHGHAMVRPSVGLRASGALNRAPVGRSHFAHTDFSGLALFEEAFHHGRAAAAEVSRLL
ncbi:MAG TPA: FAD-dependent oxidoreductase [Polyangiaceae bacterium]|nr:FAD-dependent oxidoreductase [Polyangiaceae bacterium]